MSALQSTAYNNVHKHAHDNQLSCLQVNTFQQPTEGPCIGPCTCFCILLDRCESLLLGKCIETSFAPAVNAARMLVQLFLPSLLIHQHIGGSVGVYAMLLQPPRLPLCVQWISYSATTHSRPLWHVPLVLSHLLREKTNMGVQSD
jgi:hypothetical protein